MNESLIRELQQQILNDPEHFDMETWGEHDDLCGVVCCMAGRVVLMTGGQITKDKEFFDRSGWQIFMPSAFAVDQLGISVEEAQRLFHPGSWPKNEQIAFLQSKRRAGDARVRMDRTAWEIEKSVQAKLGATVLGYLLDGSLMSRE